MKSQTEKGYYIPEWDEFIKGFKYEVLFPDGKYHKLIYGIDELNHPELKEFDNHPDPLMKIAHSIFRAKKLICVLCGSDWDEPFKNRCECGGFCTWGYELNKPESFNVDEDGKWHLNPVPKDTK